MSSTETEPVYGPEERAQLLQVARDSIRHGLEHGGPLPVDRGDYPLSLQAQRASFVTLHRDGNLRGCIGHLTAIQPLVADVAGNAYAAAFQDPRFMPLQMTELDDLDLEISVLSVPEPLPYADREELLGKIRPGIDGLILTAPDGHSGTFLPSVWEALPQAEAFLSNLVLKAGLPRGYWSDDIRMQRYTTESIS
jgi:AmmeMemoRadiSam system protein A